MHLPIKLYTMLYYNYNTVTCKLHLLFRFLKHKKVIQYVCWSIIYDLFILNCTFKHDKKVRHSVKKVIACNFAVILVNY